MPSLESNVLLYTDGDVFEEGALQFRLLYSGQLLGASRTDTRAKLKHEVRCELSPQLKRLWETNPRLGYASRRQADNWYDQHPEDKQVFLVRRSNEEIYAIRHCDGLKWLSHNYSLGGQGFIPLATGKMGLRVKLDILFLRPEEPGMLVQGGDLDNRIKTLFDALRLPSDVSEMGGASVSPEPIYCLLEDDRLISEVKVVADHLLLLPKTQIVSPNDVFLVIDVGLEPVGPADGPPPGPWHYVFG